MNDDTKLSSENQEDSWIFEDLSASGLSLETIAKMNIIPTPKGKEGIEFLKSHLGFSSLEGRENNISRICPSYLIPYPQKPFCRLKLQSPLGDMTKYLSPSAKKYPHQHIYFLNSQEEILDRTHPLWITEGEKKYAKIYQESSGNAIAIGLPGVSTWSTVKEFSQPLFQRSLRDRLVYIFFDQDFHENPDVARELAGLYFYCLKHKAKVYVCTWDPRYKGIDDYLVANPNEKIENITRSSSPDIFELIDIDSETLASVLARAKYSPAKISILWNSLKLREKLEVDKRTFSSLVSMKKKETEKEDFSIQRIQEIAKEKFPMKFNLLNEFMYLDGKPLKGYEFKAIAVQIMKGFEKQSTSRISMIMSALEELGLQEKFNPLEEWYEGLDEWVEGRDINYIGELASKLSGDIGDDLYLQRKLEIIFASHIAKWMKQEQTFVPVLIGPKGIGKSVLVRWLCPLHEYFQELNLDPNNKDHQIQASRYIMGEIGELGAVTKRADREVLKNFLTRKFFTIRAPWGRFEQQYPHRCCWWGTANREGGFLFDSEGDRRYIAIHLDSIDWSYESIPLKGIWSQAKSIFLNNNYLPTEEEKIIINESNKKEIVADPIWDYLSESFVRSDLGDAFVTASEVLDHLLSKGLRPSQFLNRSINAYFDSIGAVKGRKKFLMKYPRGWYGVQSLVNKEF